MEKKIRELAKIVLDIPLNSDIAIFPHIGVDGDCLGSVLALRNALSSLGHQVYIITNKAVPAKFSFMPEINEFKVFDDNVSAFDFIKSIITKKTFDYGILVDCSQADRTGSCASLYEQSDNKIILDHHFTSSCEVAFCFIDPTACAAGAIIYRLIDSLEKESGRHIFNSDIATNLMTSIISDTGGFRYSNTNKEAFGISKDLITRFTVNIREITYQIFEKTSVSRICILGKAFSSVVFYHNNKIAICPIKKEMIDSCNALDTDVDGICSELKTVDGVIVAFVVRETANGDLRVNIRSSEQFDASGFASKFGGGGHMRAAGFTLSNITIEEAQSIILDSSIELL